MDMLVESGYKEESVRIQVKGESQPQRVAKIFLSRLVVGSNFDRRLIASTIHRDARMQREALTTGCCSFGIAKRQVFLIWIVGVYKFCT
jgi:hypothetical protein